MGLFKIFPVKIKKSRQKMTAYQNSKKISFKINHWSIYVSYRPLILVTLIIFFISQQIFAQKVWYVDNSSSGNDSRNGLTPTIPFPDDGITGPKKTLSGISSGAIVSSASGDTICLASTGISYDTSSGEQEIISVPKNLIFKTAGGDVTIGSIFQVNDTLDAPSNIVNLESGGFIFTTGFSLTAGILSVGNKVTVGDNSLITVDAGSLVKAGSGDITYGNDISVRYAPSNSDYSSTGTELPSNVKKLIITRLTNVINRKTTLNRPLTVTDSLVIMNDFTASTLAPIKLNGDLIIAKDTFSIAGQPIIKFDSVLTFAGDADTKIFVSTDALNAPIAGHLEINKEISQAAVTLTGGNLKMIAGNINFVKGILKTSENIIYLAAPTIGELASGAYRQGFENPSNESHIVGKVAKILKNDGTLSGSSDTLSIFPVGTSTVYRPVSITFKTLSGLPTIPNAEVVVCHVDSTPGGVQGIPIKDGIEPGINIDQYMPFYWKIFINGSVDQKTVFDLSLSGGHFTRSDFLSNVRIIRRNGIATDLNNDWLLQGNSREYKNEIAADSGITITSMNSTGGLRTGGALFTYGLRSRIQTIPFSDQTNAKIGTTIILPLAGHFTDYIGTLTYWSSSTNISVVTCKIVNDTLIITLIKDGAASINVKATDSNNDSAVLRINVSGGATCCYDGIDLNNGREIPKEYFMNQSYPNPSNPTSNILFGIPQFSSVKISIYDLLGREISILVNDDYKPGYYSATFDGSKLASGIYFYRMISQTLNNEHKVFISSKKLMLVK